MLFNTNVGWGRATQIKLSDTISTTGRKTIIGLKLWVTTDLKRVHS